MTQQVSARLSRHFRARFPMQLALAMAFEARTSRLLNLGLLALGVVGTLAGLVINNAELRWFLVITAGGVLIEVGFMALGFAFILTDSTVYANGRTVLSTLVDGKLYLSAGDSLETTEIPALVTVARAAGATVMLANQRIIVMVPDELFPEEWLARL